MRAAGFSLIEVLVATAVVIVGVASLAQLVVVSADASRTARVASMTLLLAEQKMEGLRGEATGSKPSPPEALSANTEGYFDYLDASGRPVAGASMSWPATAIYVRRWSVLPPPGGVGDTLVLQVLVLPRATARGSTRLVSAKRKAS